MPGSSGDHERADEEIVEDMTAREEATQVEAASGDNEKRRRLREADDEDTFDQKKSQVQRDKNKGLSIKSNQWKHLEKKLASRV